MATIQLGNTKGASKLMSYCEKRAVEVSGVNCPSEYARSQFQATRELWGKPDGIQAHHVIQSFKPGEVSPQQANEIGKDLAEKIAKGHEATVYTHADKGHIHNHIVINSVNFENGKKYQSNKKDLYKIRETSDKLCQDKGLSVVKEPSASVRYTLAEKGLLEKGQSSWKEDIREVIDSERQSSTSYEDFKKNLTEKYGIEVKERGKNISFKHPDSNKFVRGKTLGLDYERGTIENGFEIQIASQERGHTDLSSRAEKSEGTGRTFEGDNQTERTNEKLHRSPSRQGYDNTSDPQERTEQHNQHQQGSTRGNAFDFEKAEKHARNLQRGITKDIGEWQTRNESQQPSNTGGNEQNRQEISKGLGADSREEQSSLDQPKGKDLGFDMER